MNDLDSFSFTTLQRSETHSAAVISGARIPASTTTVTSRVLPGPPLVGVEESEGEAEEEEADETAAWRDAFFRAGLPASREEEVELIPSEGGTERFETEFLLLRQATRAAAAAEARRRRTRGVGRPAVVVERGKEEEERKTFESCFFFFPLLFSNRCFPVRFLARLLLSSHLESTESRSTRALEPRMLALWTLSSSSRRRRTQKKRRRRVSHL